MQHQVRQRTCNRQYTRRLTEDAHREQLTRLTAPLNNIGGWVTHSIVPANVTPASDVI
jgi:hypothetical protein